MKKIIINDFDPNFRSCDNQYSSPMYDLINSIKAIKSQDQFMINLPNPDNVKFDKAGQRKSTEWLARRDQGIADCSYE